MQRIASCSCGSLKLTVEGEPIGVVACHCLACQRRTGSVFGVGAYFPRTQVSVSGPSCDYVRPTDAGHTFTSSFCPGCGTSLFWASGKNPDLLGVAVGAFVDPGFASPVRSVWEESKHGWVDIGVAAQHFVRGRT